MSAFTYKRLAATVGLALGATVAWGSGTPLTAAVPIGACSASSVASSTNDNWGEEFRLNDATARATADGYCDIANDIARNVRDVLNDNFADNIADNLADNLNRSLEHNINGNIRHLFEGSAVLF
jgi:hypothetical protein